MITLYLASASELISYRQTFLPNAKRMSCLLTLYLFIAPQIPRKRNRTFYERSQ